jgi:hypothetical protein
VAILGEQIAPSVRQDLFRLDHKEFDATGDNVGNPSNAVPGTFGSSSNVIAGEAMGEAEQETVGREVIVEAQDDRGERSRGVAVARDEPSISRELVECLRTRERRADNCSCIRE